MKARTSNVQRGQAAANHPATTRAAAAHPPARQRSAPKPARAQPVASKPPPLGITKLSSRAVQRECNCGPGKGGCDSCRKKDQGKWLHRAASGPAPSRQAPAIVDQAMRMSGTPLDPATRTFMEEKLGRDLGGVRIHTDGVAAAAARAVNAHAFTVGSEILFDSGRYDPHSPEGRKLLAHELVHTLQQADAAPPIGRISLPDPGLDSRLESEAHDIAERVLAAPAPNSKTPAAASSVPALPGAAPASSAVAQPVLPPVPAAPAAAAPAPVRVSQPATRAISRTEGQGSGSPAPPGDIPLSLAVSANCAGAQRNFRITRQVNIAGTTAGTTPAAVRLYVDKLYIPTKKYGLNGRQVYTTAVAQQQLEATLEWVRDGQPTIRPRAGLSQSRAYTDASAGVEDPALKTNWLHKMGWTEACAPALWHQFGGAPPPAAPAPNWGRPTVPNAPQGNQTCDFDHILELQIGGTNGPENLQVLGSRDNSSSGSILSSEIKNVGQAIREQIWPQSAPGATPGPNEIILNFGSIEDISGPDPAPVLTTAAAGAATSCAQVEATAVAQRASISAQCAATGPTDASQGMRISIAGRVTFIPRPARRPGTPLRIAEPTAAAPPAGGAGQQVQQQQAPSQQAAAAPAQPLAQGATPGQTLDYRNLAELVPGLLITEVRFAARPAGDQILATLDTRTFAPQGVRQRTTARTPARLASQRGQTLTLRYDQATDSFKITPANQNLQFTYPGLSPATLSIVEDANGVTGTGRINPDLPLLRNFPIEITLRDGNLSANVTVPKDRLRPPIPGMRFTDASLGISITPNLSATGNLAFEIGPQARPLLGGTVTASADANGLVLTGDISARLLGATGAQGHIEYRAGAWSGFVEISASQIHIPLVSAAQLRIDVNSHGAVLSGSASLSLPGGNSATLTARRRDESGWILSGHGTVAVPGLHPVDMNVSYDGEHITASGKTQFRLLGSTGNITITYANEHFSGEGDLNLPPGRATGSIHVHMREGPRFSGRGTISYRFTDNLVGTMGVELSEAGQVHVTGDVSVPRPIVLFQGLQDQRELFSHHVDIPILGVSLGPVSIGIIGRISGSISADYGIGPGTLAVTRAHTEFNPFEANPDFELAIAGDLAIPAHAGLHAAVRAGVGLSAGIASVTGGITVAGGAELRGGFTAHAEVNYRHGVFDITANPSLHVEPVLTLDLDADITAEAGALGISYSKTWDWKLAHFEYGSGLRFGMTVPVEYHSDRPFHLPSYNDIQWEIPQIDVGAMTRTIVDRVRGD